MAFSKARRLSDFIAADGSIPTGKFASSTITSAHLVDGTIAHADLHTNMDLTGKTVLVANASTGDSDTTAANTAFVQQEIAALVDSSPSALNTLNELAAALGDDASFSTTVTNSIATKLPLAGGTMTGKLLLSDVGNTTVAGLQLVNAGLGISSPSTDQMNFITADTTRMIIDSSGNVGIGIAPRAKLDVYQQTNRTSKTGTARGVLHLQDGDTPANNELTAITFESNSNNAASIIGQSLTNSGSSLFFGTSNSYGSGVTNTAMTINHIGQVALAGNLSVTGQGDFSTLVYVGNNNSEFAENNVRFRSPGAAYIDHNTTGQSIVFRTSNSSSLDTTGLIIDHLGNTTIRSGKKLVINRSDNATGGEITYGPSGSGFFFNDVNGDGFVFKVANTSVGKVAIGTDTPSAHTPLTAYYSANSQFNIGGPQAGISNNVYYNGSAYTNRNTSAGGTLIQMATDGSFAFRRATSGSSPTLSYSMYIDANGSVGIGPTSITAGVKLEVHGGKIYVPNHGIQAQTAILQSNTTMNFAEQPANGNSYTSPAANKTMAVFGSNSSTCGIAIQRDMSTGFPDFAVMPGGTTYFNGNTTQVGAGASNASMYASEPGYVGVGRKIDSHEWKNWAGTGNYTARLYTPIVHTEGNMFQIEIDVFGYGTGGKAQRYIGGGYAYAGSTLIANATVALSGTLNHRLTTATHPTAGIGTVVVFDLGYTANNGTAYYNHMRWRYVGWQQKNPADFVWGAITT